MEVEQQLVYLSLGSNLGDRQINIQHAISAIEETCGKVKAISRLYESPPWGYESQNKYLNNCIALATDESPLDLLKKLKEIEQQLGRQFTVTYTDRPIDIDILFYGTSIIELKNLNIPHPQLSKRAFVLMPIAELNADFMHPQHFLTIKQLLANLSELSHTKIFGEKRE